MRTLILLLLVSSAAHSDTLHDTVKSVMPRPQGSFSEDKPDSFAIEPYVPFSHFQFQEGTKWSHKNRGTSKEQFEKGTSFSYRLYLKSYEEMKYSAESRRLSTELMQIDRFESANLRRFDSYVTIVNHVLGTQMAQSYERRRKQLQVSVDKYAARMGLSKISTKDILGDFRNLQKLESEQAEANALAEPNELAKSLPPSDQKMVMALISSLPQLQKQLNELDLSASTSERREDLSIQLERIGREVKWGEDTKIVDRLEYNHEQVDDEDTVTLTFNVPFLRFDRENRSRERALLQVKEKEAARKKSANREELKRTLQELAGLSARVESIRSRLAMTSGLGSKLKDVRDLELKAELSEFTFEMEHQMYKQGHEYLIKYLEFLRDSGALARDIDFLSPKWESI